MEEEEEAAPESRRFFSVSIVRAKRLSPVLHPQSGLRDAD